MAPDAHGYILQFPASNQGVRTIMAYRDKCRRSST